MKKYKMVWFNCIAQEDQTELILAKDREDALDTAIKIIGRETGQSYDFCLSCILSLERSGIS